MREDLTWTPETDELWGYADTGVMYPDEGGFEPVIDESPYGPFTSYEAIKKHCDWLDSHPECYEGRFQPVRIIAPNPKHLEALHAIREAVEVLRQPEPRILELDQRFNKFSDLVYEIEQIVAKATQD